MVRTDQDFKSNLKSNCVSVETIRISKASEGYICISATYYISIKKRYLKKSEFSKYGKLVTISKNSVGEQFIWFENSVLTTFSYSKDHPYITSAKRLGWWVHKMAIFADVQYCIYADIVGWSGKAQQCADVI